MAPRAEPLVTVIIPSYNMAHLLPQAVESVRTQTHRNFQILIIDDGSTDNTAEVARQWNDARIVYTRQENAGLSAARNTGLAEARGEFICFLDADDLFLPRKTELQIDHLLDNPMTAAVTGSVLRTDEDGRLLYRFRRKPGRLSRKQMFVANRTPIHALLFRRSWIDKTGLFDVTLKGAEDWDFLTRMMLLGGRIAVIPEFVCDYRLFRGSMSSDPARQTDAIETVVRKIFSNPRMQIDFLPLREEALAETWLTGARKSWLAMERALFASYFARALSHLPRLAAKPEDTLNGFIYQARHLTDAELAERKAFFFEHLPPEGHFLRALEPRWDFLAEKDRLFLAVEAHSSREALSRASGLVLKFPAEVLRHYGKRFGR